MKRDMDLIRRILLYAEENIGGGDTHLNVTTEDIKAESRKQLYGHIKLLSDSGYLDGAAGAIGAVGMRGVTMSGHDLLDQVRDPEIWAATKDTARKAGGFSISLLGEIAKGLIRTKIEQHTGVEL